jgi:hypothetical protein
MDQESEGTNMVIFVVGGAVILLLLLGGGAAFWFLSVESSGMPEEPATRAVAEPTVEVHEGPVTVDDALPVKDAVQQPPVRVQTIPDGPKDPPAAPK